MNRQEELLTGGGRRGGRWQSGRLAAIGDGGRAAVSLTPDVDGMHVHIFESLQVENSYVGHLL